MIEIILSSIFIFFLAWFFGLRTVVKMRGTYSTGADFFQAAMKDLLLGVEFAKKGDKLAALIIVIMFTSALVAIIGILFQGP